MSNRGKADRPSASELDELIDAITTDAYGEDEQLWAFCQAIEDDAGLPSGVFVVGAPVEVTAVDYDGNTRRGVVAVCRGEEGGEHRISFADVEFDNDAEAARYVAAYRRWAGLTAD